MEPCLLTLHQRAGMGDLTPTDLQDGERRGGVRGVVCQEQDGTGGSYCRADGRALDREAALCSCIFIKYATFFVGEVPDGKYYRDHSYFARVQQFDAQLGSEIVM